MNNENSSRLLYQTLMERSGTAKLSHINLSSSKQAKIKQIGYCIRGVDPIIPDIILD